MPSPAVQDYLKAIFHISHTRDAATTSAIAERLQVAAASVSGMLRRLSEQELVEHVPYYGARLTAEGEREAIRMIRRHRVLELFLVEVLGYTWDRVHEEAERLEHAVSDDMIERMAQVLGEPAFDPHGAPIPGADRAYTIQDLPSIEDLAEGCEAVVRQVSDEDGDALRYLAGMKLTPGAAIVLVEKAPFNGPLRVRIGDREEFLGRELARSIMVEPLVEPAAAGDSDA